MRIVHRNYRGLILIAEQIISGVNSGYWRQYANYSSMLIVGYDTFILKSRGVQRLKFLIAINLSINIFNLELIFKLISSDEEENDPQKEWQIMRTYPTVT